ncbi:hypothetical protein [Lutibacter sp. B1]|jgi:glucan phosphoethanolaminetransferase (alkaline phosphatase superfamily)|uniref:hypothetical protein n=1 Tax=Lutibacter sp. B1 TaxID=2725996 RepID=UPI00145733E5|nr:hypothetical protein [Lutibacter sp. B1]NLP57714.1 hypothetical protein [Lutibacter sp. B1]
MNKNVSKILTLATGALGLIGFFFFIRVLMAGDEVIETDVAVQSSVVSPFITYAVYLLIAVSAVAIISSLLNLIKNPQALKRSLISLVILCVLLVLAYVISSGDQVLNSAGKVLSEAGSVSKWVSTLINYTFILGTIGLIFFVFDFMKSLIKN